MQVLEVANSGGPASKSLPAATFPRALGPQVLQRAGDIVFSDAVADIRDDSGVIGVLLVRSTFVETPKGIFSRLVGRDATVRVANRRGDIWTNFDGSVPPVPVDLGHPGVAQYRAATGEMRIGAVSHIRATPWAAWVDFPLAAVMAPAHLFLSQMIPVTFVVLAVAAVAVSILSARITRPLSALSGAAETIASGDYSRRVRDDRPDEIGWLGRTFNTMAGQIQESQQRLEARVAERTAQLEAANQELQAFSYSVSHDLRAPLRSIDGFSQALLDDAADQLDDKCKTHLHRVRAAAHRMGELIDDLLELSRVGRAELRRSQVSLSDIARAVAADLNKSAPNRQVTVEIEDGLVANADRGLAQVVLENLLGNAWKFTAHTAPATIQIGGDRMKDVGGAVTYFVRDNGAGFDMAYADKLFRPFQRLHGQGEFPGTGIGLATVHRIIDRHGGRVWAEGAVGKGATVFFTIPRPEQDAHA